MIDIYDKKYLRSLAPTGWDYGGYDADSDRFLYMTGDYAKGFKLMECAKEDLTKENLALMARMNLTRPAKGKA